MNKKFTALALVIVSLGWTLIFDSFISLSSSEVKYGLPAYVTVKYKFTEDSKERFVDSVNINSKSILIFSLLNSIPIFLAGRLWK